MMNPKKMFDSMLPSVEKVVKEMKESMKILQKHLIQVQENQVEFEKYLKDMQKQLDRIEKKGDGSNYKE